MSIEPDTEIPATEITVHRTVTVPLSTERAFALFTARMGEFWPRSHHLGDAPLADVIVQPRVGGRWHERDADGAECEWGRVVQWAPPHRVVLLWQLNADWRYDPEFGTEVEVDFTAESDGRTRVDLRHRHIERFGERAEDVRAALGAENGWNGILACYTESAATPSTVD